MEILNKKQKIIVIAILILIIIFIGYYVIKKTNNYNTNNLEILEEEGISENNAVSNQEQKEEYIIVHIAGEVIYNGIIEIEKGSRLADVIERAGGLTDEADLSKINLAYQVGDGQKIYIPNVNEIAQQECIIENAGDNIITETKDEYNKGKVNINTAMQTELETLNGIGPSTALKIINYRKEHGNFTKIEDLKDVPGIGDVKFESIKEDICVK